jgi:PST family polysaccharide transporter
VSPTILRIARGQIARNALSLYGLQGLSFLAPLITLPYLLHLLGPEGYGSIVFAQSLIGYGIVITDFGFNLTAARDISVAREDERRVAEIYWSTQAARALLLLLSACITAAVVALAPRLRHDWPVFAVCGVTLLGSGLFPTWYFQGLEKLRYTALLQAASKCLATAAIFLFVRSSQDLLLAALLMSCSQVLGLAVAIVLRIPAAPKRFYLPTLAAIRGALAGSFDMFLSTVSSSLYLNTNVFLLGLMAGTRQVAYYSVANRFVSAVLSLVSPVLQAIFPRASLLFATSPTNAWHLIRRVSWLLFPALILGSLLTILLAPQIVRILAGPSYAQAVPVVRIMAPVPVLVTAAGLLAQTIMVNMGLTRYLWRIYLAVGALNLAILPVLIHLFSANGAAASLTIAETAGPLLMLAALRPRVTPSDGHLPLRAGHSPSR